MSELSGFGPGCGVFRCVLRPYLRGPPSARDNNNNRHRNGPRLRRNVENASHEQQNITAVLSVVLFTWFNIYMTADGDRNAAF